MRHVLNSSDIKYAGKLVFKKTCFGSLSPRFLLSWDVGRDTYLRESRMKVVFPCRRGRPVSKTRGRPNRPRGGRCHIFWLMWYSQLWPTNIHNFDQQIFTTLTNNYTQFLNNTYLQFDQTSAPKCRSLVEVWSKFGRDSDKTSTLGVSKFGWSLVEVWCRSLIGIWSNTLILQCVLCMCRANFDQTSTLGVSKFGRSFYKHSTKLPHWCRSLAEVDKIRH